MRSRLGHVTLLGAEFQPPKLSPQSGLRRQAASRLAPPGISSLGLFLYYIWYSWLDLSQVQTFDASESLL